MTITFALMRSFVASFVVGVGIGMALQAVNRMIRAMFNGSD